MINPIKFCFPEAVFIPCYFHFIQNCLKHFSRFTRNIKILCFINLSQFNAFFKKIKSKYNSLYGDFINYIEKNYIISKQFGSLSFNYNSLVSKDIDEGFKFYTNNITEAFNRTLNSKYVGGEKTFYHF